MPLFVRSRRAGSSTQAGWEQDLRAHHATVTTLDLTSRGPQPWVQFSPFFPHGDIPVPFSPGVASQTVEGIWQALKVFEHEDVDPSKLAITNMSGIKRTVRSHGHVLGHRKGLGGEQLLPYGEARRLIYLPAYLWLLEHHLQSLVGQLREMAEVGAVILLDYETNTDIDNLTKPLSHAGLVVAYLEGRWPA